jgi:flavodoxin
MKITVVYDSISGNTAEIAKSIAVSLSESNAVRLLTAHEARSADLADTDLLIVGSPTRAFRPTPAIAEYVEGLGGAGSGKAAAVFDTRLDPATIEPPPLRWVVEAGGYAAPRVATSLAGHGFSVDPETPGFLVTGPEGGLKPKERDRAVAWGLSLVSRRAAHGQSPGRAHSAAQSAP